MLRRKWSHDTVATRLLFTVIVTVMATAALGVLFTRTAGVYARPDLKHAGLLEQAAADTRLMSAAPFSLRERLATAASNSAYTVKWIRSAPPSHLPPIWMTADADRIMQRLLGRPGLHVTLFESSKDVAAARHDPLFGAAAFGMAVPLEDGSLLVFAVQQRLWGMNELQRDLLLCVFSVIWMLAISILAARSLVGPMRRFAEAATRFGSDPRAPPMPQSGPRELRDAIAAFNAMQTQIGRFVEDRTNMLAAISHDLRTPLTRIRLRAEFVEDAEQQRRLFQDVADMRAMINAALALFRDEATEEEATDFDLSELIRVVVDDLADEGKEASFEGVDHSIYRGRPGALKRGIANLAENACLYGGSATLCLARQPGGFLVTVEDQGPGVPEALFETVFQPFYRIERSRSRRTGGAGLGLTSARMIVRSHGGEISLRNREERGLSVSIVLPHVDLLLLRP